MARFQLLMAPQPLKKRFTSWGPSAQSISLWRMFQIQTITGSGEYTRTACSSAHWLPVKSALWTEPDSQLQRTRPCCWQEAWDCVLMGCAHSAETVYSTVQTSPCQSRLEFPPAFSLSLYFCDVLRCQESPGSLDLLHFPRSLCFVHLLLGHTDF